MPQTSVQMQEQRPSFKKHKNRRLREQTGNLDVSQHHTEVITVRPKQSLSNMSSGSHIRQSHPSKKRKIGCVSERTTHRDQENVYMDVEEEGQPAYSISLQSTRISRSIKRKSLLARVKKSFKVAKQRSDSTPTRKAWLSLKADLASSKTIQTEQTQALEKAHAELGYLRSCVAAFMVDFECPICKETLDSPHALYPCGHIYCENCLFQTFTTPLPNDEPGTTHATRRKLCPSCRACIHHPPVPIYLVKRLLRHLHLNPDEVDLNRHDASASSEDKVSWGDVFPDDYTDLMTLTSESDVGRRLNITSFRSRTAALYDEMFHMTSDSDLETDATARGDHINALNQSTLQREIESIEIESETSDEEDDSEPPFAVVSRRRSTPVAMLNSVAATGFRTTLQVPSALIDSLMSRGNMNSRPISVDIGSESESESESDTHSDTPQRGPLPSRRAVNQGGNLMALYRRQNVLPNTEVSAQSVWTERRWNPPIHTSSYNHIPGLTNREHVLHARGIPLGMLDKFQIAYSHNSGLYVQAGQGNVIYLGWNVDVLTQNGDEDGEIFMAYIRWEMRNQPHRWRIESHFNGSWDAYRLQRQDLVVNWDDTDSDNYMSDEDELETD